MCPVCKNGARPTPCPACKAEREEVDRALGDGSHADAKRLYAGPMDTALDPERDAAQRFVDDVLAEVAKARAKFGGQPSETTGLALSEEVGEVNLAVALNARSGAAIRKLLHIKEGKSGEDDLYLECVQTAAMALRLATERTDRTDWPGNKRGCGGSYEIGSGGHTPGVAGEGCEACDRDFPRIA